MAVGTGRLVSHGSLSLTSGRDTPSLRDAAIEARRVSLLRLERAAGAAFGCDDAAGPPRSDRLLTAPGAIALVTLATVFAATITYLA